MGNRHEIGPAGGRSRKGNSYPLFKVLGAIMVFAIIPGASIGQSHEFMETVRNGKTPNVQALQRLSLNLTLSIDMEDQDIGSAGMGIPGEFDVDDQGNIYVVAFRNKEYFVYQFDHRGKLRQAFGKYGQGPGELLWPLYPHIINGNALSLFDGQKKTLYKFDEKGLCQEERLLSGASSVELLPNGKYLVKSFIDEFVNKESYAIGLFLYDRQFKKVRELDRRIFSLDNSKLTPYFMWRSTPKYIYAINENRGYEIWVFDLDGNPVRTIKKEFKPVHVTRELAVSIMGPEAAKNIPAMNSFFPNPLPPMSQIFVDDEDRVYVITYENGASKGEKIIDIFDDKGILISRVSLDLVWARLYVGPHYTFAKKGSLYFYRENENGYNVLYRHKMNWKREVPTR
jgi:hypothetical protein